MTSTSVITWMHAFITTAADAPVPTAHKSALTALTPFPAWALVLVAAVLLLQLVSYGFGVRHAKRSVRAVVMALRTLLTVGVFALLLEPGHIAMETVTEKNRVVVALDTSASMQTTDGNSDTRMQRAARAALQLQTQVQNSGPFVVDIVGFDAAVHPLSEDDVAALASGATKAVGTATDVLAPLALGAGSSDTRANGNASAAGPLGGLVILSDGASTSDVPLPLAASVRETLAGLAAPVHTVTIGDAKQFADVALVRARSDDFAFVRNKVTVEVVVRQRGLSGHTLPLTLSENGKAIAVTDVVLDDTTEKSATFTFEPQEAGKRILTISAPVLDGEAIASNNRIDVPIKLIRDRIRVLQVSGRPSWDERFVRRLLKENPSVDLISFFILRSTTDSANASNRELSLIPFPTRELFTEQLSTFDVVIFQDFNYAPYQMGMYLDNVRQFVEESGGGFLMVGGELSFSEGGYDQTPLANILPVRLLPGPGHLSDDAFVPVLTEAGKTHPITDLGATGDSFATLPPLLGANLVAGLAPDAVALLAHPHHNADDGPMPVVAVREVKKGRSMAILTDTTWRWSLPHVGAGGRGDAHRRFFANALRWLIRDPELSRVKVEARGTSRANVEPGQEVAIDVRTANARYQPEADDAVEVTFELLDARANQAAPPDKSAHQQSGVSDATGVWHGAFVPDAPGVWRVRAQATRDGVVIGSDEDLFVVRKENTEAQFIEPRPDILAALSTTHNEVRDQRQRDIDSQTVPSSEIDQLSFVDHRQERIVAQHTEPLWNTPLVLLILVALAGVEWWWRRRNGFA